MIAAFDIFRIVNGQPLWVHAVPTLDTAKACVQQLMAAQSTEYMILSQKTRNKISLKPGDLTWSVIVDESQFLGPTPSYVSPTNH